MPESVNARVIVELLRHRHPLPEWATFTELRDGTGYGGSRFFDFYAFNVYPSKNFLRICYEIKISRADFARELKNPEKRRTAEAFSNECYFVTPAGLVSPDELPEGWGLVEVIKNGLRKKKHATQRKDAAFPLSFAASVMRHGSLSQSPLPVATWFKAGTEMSADDLLEVAGTTRKEIKAGLIREALAEFYRTKEYDLFHRMRRIIQKYGGYGVAGDPEMFEKWLIMLLSEKPAALSKHQMRVMTDTYEMFGKLLETIGGGNA